MSVIKRIANPITVAFALVIVLFLIGGIATPVFVSPVNLQNIFVMASFIGLVGFGQTLCILIGGIDLSIPGTVAIGGLITAYYAGNDPSSLPLIVTLVLLGCLVVGLINGLVVALFQVPPILMTLGMNGALVGLGLTLTNGGTTPGSPQALRDFVGGSLLGLSNLLWIWIIVAVIATILLSFTTFGRRIYATGTNSRATYLAGINVRLTTVGPYVISALCGGLAGILLLGFYGLAFSSMGDTYLFSSAVAVAIGGASLLGGRGHYLGTIAGALILTLIPALLALLSIGPAANSIVYGVILLFAVFLARGRKAT